MPKFGHLGYIFSTNNIRFETSPMEIVYKQNFVKRLESSYFFNQNTKIWAFGPKVCKMKASRKF